MKKQLNKKEILSTLKARLNEVASLRKQVEEGKLTKAELSNIHERFNELVKALNERLATQVLTKVETEVVVSNLANEITALKNAGLPITNLADIKFDFPKEFNIKGMEKPEWYVAPKDTVKVEGIVKVEQDNGTMLSFFTSALQVLIEFLGKLQGKTFTIVKADSEYQKPQVVMLFDPHRKQLVDVKELMNVQVKGNFGGQSSTGSGGSSNSVAVYDSLDQYKIADGDEVGTTKYYGFIDKDGNWYIMKNDTTANSFRYTKGSGAYSTGWTNRTSLTYGYYDVIF